MDKLDDVLDSSFNPDRLKEIYFAYKEIKRDRFSPDSSPIYNIPMGVDGITYLTFEKQLDRNIQNIYRRISEGTYIFQPFREVEIEKQPATDTQLAKYRTLSIATIKDVIVQTLLYEDVLNKPFENLFRTLDLPQVVSFAYRKGKSAPQAALLIHKYIQEGYQYILDADLTKFFDTIPHKPLLDKVAHILGSDESRTYKLIYRYVHTDRVPFKSYQDYRRKGQLIGHKAFQWKKPLRIPRKCGVPQGGVLSGTLANLYLHEFDEWIAKDLNKDFDIRYVRYADDFIILARSQEVICSIQEQVTKKLKTPSLVLDINEDKTTTIDAYTAGLNFVGFHFDRVHIRVSNKNIERYKQRVLDILKDVSQQALELDKSDTPGKRTKRLVHRIRYKVSGYSGHSTCTKCQFERIEPPRSWGAFYKIITDVGQLRKLDKWTRQVIFEHIYEQFSIRLSRKYLKQIRFPNLVKEIYRIRKLRLKPCICDLNENGLESYARDLFGNKSFYTLSTRRPFRVDTVDNQYLHISIDNKKYLIELEKLANLWKQLKRTGFISRVELEKQGIQNASQIVALLEALPGVDYELQPICLRFRKKQ